MPSQILTIARNTFLEAVRQPIFFFLIVISGILTLFSVWGTGFSLGYTDTSEVSGDNKLLMDVGLANVFVTGMLLAAFIATAVISREIELKTVLTVVSKPVSRPAVVIGKYVGIAAAMLVASVLMLLFLLIGIRHGVLATAMDDLDQPVITFTLLAVGLAFGVGVWCNYFYGWSFTQTTTLLMLPLFLGAYVLVLLVSKKWAWQPIWSDFKPQIFLAGCTVIASHLVITSIAVAASARLGQVMTIVVCIGLFVFGLLSNHLVGSRAFRNDIVARISMAEPSLSTQATLTNPGDTWTVTLQNEPKRPLKVGDSFYYGATPNGYPLAVATFPPFGGNVNASEQLLNPASPSSVVVTGIQGRVVTIRRAGGEASSSPNGEVVQRPPESADYVFTTPTRVNAAALAIWGIVPNVQFFWLVDAVTQNQRIPASHVLLVAMYAVAQIGAFLCLAIIVFQRREVG